MGNKKNIDKYIQNNIFNSLNLRVEEVVGRFSVHRQTLNFNIILNYSFQSLEPIQKLFFTLCSKTMLRFYTSQSIINQHSLACCS